MSDTRDWSPVEGSVASILERYDQPFEALRTGQVPALILPGIYPSGDCSKLVNRFYERGLLSRPQRQEVGSPPRIDIGTSLNVHSAVPEQFFEHAAGTHRLFETVFDGFYDPVETIYVTLGQLLPDKRIMTAQEPDGRLYGPAIFRSYHNGQGHRPHYDSVSKRSRLLDYAVSRFDHQFAAVMCFQNSEKAERSGQAILYRAQLTKDVGEHVSDGTFHNHADRRGIHRAQVALDPGDLYFFYSENIHEVPEVVGDTPRIVLAAFIAMSENDDEVFVWS
jgi:hypothetical protein